MAVAYIFTAGMAAFPGVAMAHPELMTGPDLIRALVEGRLSEHAERRSNTIRAFLSDRYTEEEEVRFKQVDLQNNLLDLFIDLPIGIREQFSKKRGSSADRFNEVLGNIAAVNEPESDLSIKLCH